MASTMNKYVWLVVAVCALCAASCRDKADDSEQKKLDRARSAYLIQRILKSEDDIFAVLLSIKYNVRLDVTRRILHEFTEQDWLEGLLAGQGLPDALARAKTLEEFEQSKRDLELSEATRIRDRIEKLSSENNVPDPVVASLLIDYKVWYESRRDEQY